MKAWKILSLSEAGSTSGTRVRPPRASSRARARTSLTAASAYSARTTEKVGGASLCTRGVSREARYGEILWGKKSWSPHSLNI